MPATTINVNTVNDSIASALKQIITQEKALEDINTIINSMEGAWESEAQKVFTDSFRETYRRIDGFNTNMNESLKNMQSFVAECVDADTQTARELRGVNW